jgi:hypothetical protein
MSSRAATLAPGPTTPVAMPSGWRKPALAVPTFGVRGSARRRSCHHGFLPDCSQPRVPASGHRQSAEVAVLAPVTEVFARCGPLGTAPCHLRAIRTGRSR